MPAALDRHGHSVCGPLNNERSLEDKLRSQLHRARIARVIDLTIHRAGNVRAREGGEICVVKDIENFPPQLKRFRFAEANILGKSRIKARRRRA